MAKKREFQLDKPRSGVFSKLFITVKQRRKILKWCLYTMVLLALSVLQDVVLCRFRLFGATTELLPCAIFLICLLEGTENGCVFALLASLGYLFSGSSPGVYAMVCITVLSIVICVFRQGYLQSGFSAAVLCSTMAMVLYECVMFAFGLFLGYTIPARFGGFMITAALSLLAVPALYPVFLSIGRIGGETWKE